MIGSALAFFRIYLSIFLAVASCAVVTASGRKEPTDVEAAPERVRRFSIGTAGTTGAPYPFGVALGETITAHVPGLAATGEAAAASVENIRRLSNGEFWMAVSQNETAQAAYRGGRAFFRGRMPTISGACSAPCTVTCIFSRGRTVRSRPSAI